MTWLRYLVIAAATLAICGFLAVGLRSVTYPYDLDMYEGPLFLPAIGIAAGKPIYGPDLVLERPYLYSTYGPVYFAAVGTVLPGPTH